MIEITRTCDTSGIAETGRAICKTFEKHPILFQFKADENFPDSPGGIQ